jgi:hypothetical protein
MFLAALSSVERRVRTAAPSCIATAARLEPSLRLKGQGKTRKMKGDGVEEEKEEEGVDPAASSD